MARSILERLEFHYTPKHGSWLNIAECELSVLTRQCLKGRRFEDIERLLGKLLPWAASNNQSQRAVDWQFTTDDARDKLKSLYPKIVL